MSRTGSTALPQITFILHEEEDGWWAEWPYMGAEHDPGLGDD